MEYFEAQIENGRIPALGRIKTVMVWSAMEP